MLSQNKSHHLKVVMKEKKYVSFWKEADESNHTESALFLNKNWAIAWVFEIFCRMFLDRC